MITGDARAPAEAIARKLGITHVEAEVLPGDKQEAVKRLRDRLGPVAFAGDGITNLVLSSVFLPLAPVGRPPRAGGKRRAEPSVTSWRAHVPPKGRTRPWLRRRLRRERRR